MDRRRKHWGWGYEDQQPPADQFEAAARTLCEQLGYGLEQVEQPVALAQLRLADPRVPIPTRLAAFSAADTHARASHALGKSYVDVVRGFRGRFEHPPDFVCRPRDEIELEAVLEWCSAEGVAAIPFGGGTSVVGGVTPDVGDALQRRRLGRPRRARPGARGGRGLLGGADRGGGDRPGAGGPAA